MTRIACDSVTLAHDPTCVDVAFFYRNGRYVQAQADVAAKFPGKVILGIDVNGTDPAAAVRDWENGDKAGDLQQWVIDHNKASGLKDATVYCNRSTVPEVRQLTGSQVLGRDYFLFVSSLDGTLVTGPGIVACQIVTAPENYDVTVIYDDSWHPSPSPVAHIKANLREELAGLSAVFAGLVVNTGRLPG